MKSQDLRLVAKGQAWDSLCFLKIVKHDDSQRIDSSETMQRQMGQ